MNLSTFYIEKMDCPCEENLIRMALAEMDNEVVHLNFDLNKRQLQVTHTGEVTPIAERLSQLNLGSVLKTTETTAGTAIQDTDEAQRRLLRRVLMVNALFFILEMTTGLIGRSMGLVADSLDMLADALVYGMSLLAVGAVVSKKKKVAFWSGWIQMLLAVTGLIEVLRRCFMPEIQPDSTLMIVMSALALIANAYCLWLLTRHQSSDAHIRASVIFSANDVIINLGVILTGVAVWLLESRIPDLLIGTAVFIIVARGALRILKLAK